MQYIHTPYKHKHKTQVPHLQRKLNKLNLLTHINDNS